MLTVSPGGGELRRQPGARVRDPRRAGVADHRHRRPARHRAGHPLQPGRLVVAVQRQEAVAVRAPWPRCRMADSRARVRRVSSQQIRSAVASTSRARGERSPRFPIGVATSTSRPRRSSLTSCRLLHRSAPSRDLDGPRADRPPARPSARRSRPRSARHCGPSRPPMATRHGLSRVSRTTVRSVERKATSMGNFMPAVCTVRGAVDVQGALAARPPAQRAALGWRVGQLERAHHIAVPQQPSGPHPPEATGPPAAFRLGSLASCRSERSSASSGRRRRPTTARSRTAAAADASA